MSARSRDERRRRREAAAKIEAASGGPTGDTNIETPEQFLSSHRAKINEAISKLEGLLGVQDALDLITPLAIGTQFVSLGEQPEPSPQPEPPFTPAILEYALSFASAVPRPVSPQPVSEQSINEFFGLLTYIHEQVQEYYLTEALYNRAGDSYYQNKHQLLMRNWTISVRGGGYHEFAEEIYLELFGTIKDLMSEKIGFEPKHLIQFCRRVFDGIESSVPQSINRKLLPLKELHHRYLNWCAAQASRSSSQQDFKDFVASDELARDFDWSTVRDSLSSSGSKSDFRIVAQNEFENKIIDALALDLGANNVFLSKSDWRGWPLGETLVSKRPLTRVGNEVYAMSIHSLMHSQRFITEAALQRAVDETTYASKYLRKRDKYLETKVTRMLETWFSGGKVIGEIFYKEANDSNKRCELDCLVQFGDALLLVEVKAGKMNPAARRGGIKKMDSDLKNLVMEAHEQAYRAWKYIDMNGVARFHDARGTEVMQVNRRRCRHVFLINVTLDDLAPIAPNIANATKIEGCPWFAWSVSLVDLMVIREILPSASVFLHYLHRREEAQKGVLTEAQDELDFLMFYINQGLHTHDMQANIISLCTCTDPLDDYFLRKSKELNPHRPSPQIPPSLETLITSVDAQPRENGPSVVFSVLDCDSETRDKIAQMVVQLEEMFENDGELHHARIQVHDYIILLACRRELLTKEDVRKWARKWIMQGTNVVYAAVWAYPVRKGDVRSFRFDLSNS